MSGNDSPVHRNAKKRFAVTRNALRINRCIPRFLALASGLAVMLVLITSAMGLSVTPTPSTLPTGGQIVSGQGAITSSGNKMTVVQNQSTMVVNWSTFNIGQNASVNFIQPSSTSSALNRILDQNPSQILGCLKSNGLVFLLDPAGIIFGSSASINVGGLVASSLNLSNADYLSGKFTFTSTGQQGGIVNQGTINAGKYGVVAMIGPQVSNTGTISAPGGSVALGAGNRVTLDFAGDGLLKLSVDKTVLDTEVKKGTAATAGAGLVGMTPKAEQDVTSTVVNNSGVIEANSISGKNGEIILDGGAAGTVTNSGAIAAKGNRPGETGGTVTVTGKKVALLSGSSIDVSGYSGGGTVNVGGGRHGADGSISNADDVYVDQGATINANATQNGNGGQVTVWSQDHTTFAGTISAKGGARGGNGGSVETSGQNTLEATGTVLTLAPSGTVGIWLLDPADIVIAQSGGTITPETIENGLANGNVALDTNAGSGTAQGNITVSSGVSWSSNSTLSLLANNSIAVNAAITGTGGGNLVLRADSQGTGSGTVSFGAGGAVSLTGGSGGGNNVSIYYNPASNSTTYANPTKYSGYVAAGNLTAYMLVNSVSDLQNMSENLAGDYALGTNIDASATSAWNAISGGGYAGFTPVGTASAPFTGIFNGQLANGSAGAINGLYINLPGSSYVGLFGYTNNATVENVGIVNGSITGFNNVGALTGEADGSATVSNVSNNGTAVNGNYYVGGLVGSLQNGGTFSITGSSNSGAVTPAQNTDEWVYAGGIVGLVSTNGTIDGCSNSGAITGAGDWIVGGLVGANTAVTTISNSNNSGAVSGYTGIGGLVGYGGGLQVSPVPVDMQGGALTIVSSFNASTVTGTGDSSSSTGGLVGAAGGCTITSSYNTAAGVISASGTESGEVGGLIGHAENSSISYSYNAGAVSLSGTDISGAGGLAGNMKSSTITSSYNTGAVSATSDSSISGVGGLVGNAKNSSTISSSYNTGAVNANAGTGGEVYDIGGLVGEADSSALTSSYNNSTGSVTVAGDYSWGVGGLVGVGHSSSITNSNNWGPVVASANGDDTGGIVGELDTEYSTSALVNSCNNYASVTGGSSTGGIVGSIGDDYDYTTSVGNTYVSVTNSNNSGAVTGGDSTGGLVGNIEGYYYSGGSGTFDVTLSSSNNSGAVTGSYYTGGIVGNIDIYSYGSTSEYIYNTVLIDKCGNSGQVSGTFDVGGVAGYVYIYGGGSTTISNSFDNSTLPVTGTEGEVGGVAGYLYAYGGTATITDSYNLAPVSGTGTFGYGYDVGGVVGYMAASDYSLGTQVIHGLASVTSSWNSGAVSGSNYVGGVAGEVDTNATVWGSYNKGNVTSSGYDTGGVAGYDYGMVSNSYNLGAVSGTYYVGGIVGEIYSPGILVDSFNTGVVTGSGNIGGIAGYANGVSISSDYFDMNASGLGTSTWDSAQGLSTSQMQGSSPFSGWDYTNTWYAPGGAYPILKWQQGGYVTVSGDISGSAFSSLGGDLVQLVVNGNALGQAYTAANGFYALLVPSSSLPAGQNLLAFASGAGTQAASVVLTGGSSVSGLSLWANDLLSGPGESVSGVLGAKGGYSNEDIPYYNDGNGNLILDYNINLIALGLNLDANVTTSGTGAQTYIGLATLLGNATLTSGTGAIVLNGGVSDNGSGYNLTIDTNGTVSQNAPISVSGLQLLGNGADFELATVENSVGTLAGYTPNGIINFANAGDITIGVVNGTQGLTAPFVSVTAGLTDTTTVSGPGTIYVEAPITSTTVTGLGASSGINLDSTVNANSGLLVIGSYGTVSQNSGENNAITANNLQLAGGDFELTNASNKVNTIAALGAGTVNFQNTGDLTVGQVSSPPFGEVSGITASSDIGLYTSGNILVNSPISGGGNLVLRPDSQGTGTGTVTFGSPGLLSIFGDVSIFYNPASNGTTYANPINYSGDVTSGNLTAYILVNNVNGLQNMSENLAGDYALGTNIDASGTSSAGFTPIGSQATPFTGVFNGNGQTISALNINLPTSNYVGLFGYTRGATISNVTLAGGSVTGGQYVGGLVGEADNTTIANISNSGLAVSGQSFVGGLAGYASSTSIDPSSNSGAITGTNDVGGIAGYATGAVIDSVTNTGAIKGYAGVGGLVGYAQDTTITNSTNGSASDPTLGAVTGQSANTGGLVGELVELASSSYITTSANYGPVSGGAYTGGLVGSMTGTISDSYNTGPVYGLGQYAGGVAGYLSGSITDTANLGSVAGSDYVGGLAGYVDTTGYIDYSYSVGRVTATGTGGNVGGIAGYAANGAYAITSDYFDLNTSGLTGSWDKAQGLTDTQMAQQASFAGWDFTYTWAIQEGKSYPYLQWFSSWGGTQTAGSITISGTISGLTNLVGDLIDFAVDGTIVGDCFTLAGGAFSLSLSSGSISSGDSLLAFLSGAGTPGASVSLSSGGNISGLSILANTLLAGSGESVSGILGAKGGLTSSDIPYSSSGANLLLANNISLVTSDLKLDGNITTSGTGTQTFNGALTLSGGTMLSSPGGISFNGAVNGAGQNLTLNSSGAVSQAGPISAAGLELLGAGGNYQLTDGQNSVTTLSANTGTLNFANAGDLTIGTAGGTTGITTSAATTVQAGGNITLAGGVSANGIILAASGNFINNVPANPLNAGTGSWLIYSADPRLDTLNGITPNFIEYDASYPSTAAATGNGLLYSLAPVIDVSLQGVVDKTYDATTSASLTSANFAESGVIAGDSVNLTLPSSGLFSDKNAGSGKQVTASGIGIASATNNGIRVYGYQLASSSASGNIGTITPAALVIAAVSDTKAYDGTVESNGVPTVSGLKGSDQATDLSQVFDSPQPGTRTLSVNGYDIVDGNNGSNYTITFQTASGQITGAAVQPQTYVPSIVASLTASQTAATQNNLGTAQTANGTSSLSGGVTQKTTEESLTEVETEAAPVGGVSSDVNASLVQGAVFVQTTSAADLIQTGTASQNNGDFSGAARDFRSAVVNLLDQGSVVQARQAIELMDNAELADYYQDASIVRGQVHGTTLKDLPDNVAAIYTVISPHRLDLIVCFHSGMKKYSTPIDATALSQDIASFRISLQRRTSWGYMSQARKLYSLIIEPMEAELRVRGVDTLVFIPDGALRTVPFAALNDGHRFLIEKFALAVTPSLGLTDSRTTVDPNSRALAAGLSESVQGFAPLPNVGGELKDVHAMYNSDVLENVAFVGANLQKNLKENSYSIVHIATHGSFGPKGQDTFLLTYDSKIDMNQLEGLMKGSKDRIGLLCLSACETAVGDERAALGLAGVAVKAGSRSALATLWNVSDQAAPLLVQDFYDELKAPSVSEAQALQQAQLKLMDDPRFSHPFYWSPFLMIGNWR